MGCRIYRKKYRTDGNFYSRIINDLKKRGDIQ